MKKKIISLVLVFVIVAMLVPVASASVNAIYTKSKIIIDSKEVGFEAYNINGNNYFKLRDVAMAISGTSKQFEVSWNKANNAVEMKSETPYTSTGGELVLGDGQNKTATEGTQKFIKDGQSVDFTAYNIKGNNYIKLRDLGVAFRFEVYWDADKNSIIVDTSREYTGIAPKPEIIPEQIDGVPYYSNFPHAIDFGAMIGAPVLETLRQESELGYITIYVYDRAYLTEEAFSKYVDILVEKEYYYLEEEGMLTLISPEGYSVILSWDENYIGLGVVEERIPDDIMEGLKESNK